jgi:hypothetical protein
MRRRIVLVLLLVAAIFTVGALASAPDSDDQARSSWGRLAAVTTVSSAEAHYISGWKKVVDSKVNGLCGQGARYVCATWAGIRGRYLYDGGGHWRVYEVHYYEVIPFSPWSSRQCRADKVWVEHNARIGSFTKANLCWK